MTYLRKLFGHSLQEKESFLVKFNNAIGFKKYSEEIEYDENFETPLDIFYQYSVLENLHDPQEIVTFYIPKEKYTHKITKESYHTFGMSMKFIQFIRKVFPAIYVDVIRVKERKTYQPINYFYRQVACYAIPNYGYSTDCFFEEELSKEGIDSVYQFLNYSGASNYKIYQDFCECEHCKKTMKQFRVTIYPN